MQNAALTAEQIPIALPGQFVGYRYHGIDPQLMIIGDAKNQTRHGDNQRLLVLNARINNQVLFPLAGDLKRQPVAVAEKRVVMRTQPQQRGGDELLTRPSRQPAGL